MRSAGWVFVACAVVGSGGCRRTDLARARYVFARWDASWVEARPCLVGTKQRSADLATQVELAELLDERPACPTWFRDAAPLPEQDLRAALDTEKVRKEDIRAHENIDNMWSELTAPDLTDEAAAALEALNTATRALQRCAKPSCPAFVASLATVETARVQLRAQLGVAALPPDAPSATTPVKDLTPRPSTERPHLVLAREATGEAELGAGWRISKQAGATGAVYTVTSATGKTQRLDATTMSAVFAVRDDHDPVLWLDPVRIQEDLHDFLRVYELAGDRWVGLDVGPALYVGAARHRVDVIFGGAGATPPAPDRRAMSWVSFGPGHHDHKVTALRCAGDASCTPHTMVSAGCSADDALWEADTSGDQPSWRRWELRKPGAASFEVGAVDDDMQCDDDAVMSAGTLCNLASQTCEEVPRRYARRALVRGAVANVGTTTLTDDDPRRQLIVVALHGAERFFRLPAKARLDHLRAEDGKLLGVLKGTAHQEVELW